MPRSNLERFQRRLALVAYFRHRFGVEDIHDPASVRAFYNTLSKRQEGYDAEGRSYVYSALHGIVRGIDTADLLRYDANVKRHTDALNRRRTEPITLKYFQILAALMSEYYLDRTTSDADAFLADLNAFVATQNEARNGRIDYPTFSANDLNKLAFWMATGSGKTLLMHLNYYQYRHYRPDAAENILLVTPNEGLSQQHVAEMAKSAIPARRFTASSDDLFGAAPHTVKVIEITKLVEEKTGGGESLEVSAFEGRNLVFVDEGHKGAGSTAQAWRNRREALAEQGFTFEYSATFGQAMGGAGADVEEEYGKAIIFDYAYPRFYEDGYGKDYRILNLEEQFPSDLRERYLLANLLTFYEQVRCYNADDATFYAAYNVAPPLLVFIGHTVTAGKTRSQLSKNDRQSLSDVQELALFLHRVLANEDRWVPETIDAILAGGAGLERPDGSDIFADAFRALRDEQLDGATIYADMLERIFHVGQSAGLHLVNLSSAAGEIGLRAGAADRFFGLINIGDDANFLNIMEKKAPQIAVESEQFGDALFRTINRRRSPINVLLGAKKFIEGWDSWRVSTMGLMNIGRGEGPQIIQLFGRGVRLLGKDRSLKRSEAIEGEHPARLPLLETLNIFGVRAGYMAQFRDYLAEEGIDTDERETLIIETKRSADFRGKGLLVIRPRIEVAFADDVRLPLTLEDASAPHINLTPRAEMLVSDGLARERPSAYEAETAQTLPAEALPLFDWRRLYREIWRFCAARGYHNLALDHAVLRRMLAEGHYWLQCPDALLQVNSFDDAHNLERIALMILRKYVENFYTRACRRWEKEQLAYFPLDDEAEREDGAYVHTYEAQVKRSADAVLDELRQMIDTPALYGREDGLPDRVHFDRHLYLPLLLADTSDEQVIKYSPPGLNPGERRFVEALRHFFVTGAGDDILADWELFLLRNQSRGRGIGFLIGRQHDQRFFPDFILWLRGEHLQHIVFIDPHGLVHAGNLDADPKVRFHQEIGEYEQALNQKANRADVRLHAYLISQTSYDQLRRLSGLPTRAAFHQRHIYFPDDGVGEMLRNTLSASAPPHS